MDKPLYSMFTGADAEGNSHALLKGRLPITDGIDSYTQSFLEQCHFHQGHSMIPMEVSPDDHTYFWSHNPENKGSEPHGLHNGHYKAGIYSPTVAQCDALFRHTLLITGFIPDNWRHLMNCAIEKKPGDFWLTKMRTIQLMNSESQANYKKLGRLAMAYGEDHHLLVDAQCRSGKHHQEIDLALSKRLVWDLLILQRRSAGWISNDAKSCFDWVVHWVAVIAMMRMAITWNVLRMMFDTLAMSTHQVQTGFGDSEESFHPPSIVPFQGCGVLLLTRLQLETLKERVRKYSISSHFSPQQLIDNVNINYKSDMVAELGQYVHAIATDSNNSMEPQSIEAIYIEPTKGQLTGHGELNLNTKKMISRPKVVILPVTDQVIQRVEAWAAAKGVTSMKFFDKKRDLETFQDGDQIAGVDDTEQGYLEEGFDQDYEPEDEDERDFNLRGQFNDMKMKMNVISIYVDNSMISMTPKEKSSWQMQTMMSMICQNSLSDSVEMMTMNQTTIRVMKATKRKNLMWPIWITIKKMSIEEPMILGARY
ncbi:unnamed protein product [Cylindrotheca closterium]|uniref:Uncharacterized protein n=1 Tax=Cylindrotheca closterium TaxID=2856 RepID=A0AAD2FK11_9STRA|nr:unnamed protein product [Cylindrotheca closterium]